MPIEKIQQLHSLHKQLLMIDQDVHRLYVTLAWEVMKYVKLPNNFLSFADPSLNK